MDNHSSSSSSRQELDLREVACLLWRGRAIIAATTLALLLVSAIYAFFSAPVYQTSTILLPPTASGLAQYNMALQLVEDTLGNNRGEKPTTTLLSAQEANRIFLRHLNSDMLRQEFFANTYLPAKNANASESERELLWNRLEKELKIGLPTRTGDAAWLTLEGEDPTVISSWANGYVQAAIVAAREELMADVSALVTVRRQGNREQLAALRKIAAEARTNQIQRVEDALRIAESVGLQDSSSSGNLIIDYKDETMYLRGAKALRAELKGLQQRKDDDPYIPELRERLRVEALLSGINLDPAQLSPAIVDREAEIAVTPIRPQKALILAVSAILGLLLGSGFVILRASLQRR